MQIEHCNFDDNALYDLDNDVWVRAESETLIVLGITTIHSALAGRLKEVKFKPEGTVLNVGQSVATLESSRYFGAVRTPISGRLLEHNQDLLDNPKLANDSPYGDGWFARIEPRQLAPEIAKLSSPTVLEDKIRARIRELRVRCFEAYPDYEMWEIGVECAAVLVRLNDLIGKAANGEVVHVVSDDPTADIEMVRWSDQTGQEVLESRQEGKLAHFIVKKVK